jgi:hypothetical protein
MLHQRTPTSIWCWKKIFRFLWGTFAEAFSKKSINW